MGEFKAKDHYFSSKKGSWAKLEYYLEKLLSRLKIDAAELLAMGAATFLIYNVLKENVDFVNSINKVGAKDINAFVGGIIPGIIGTLMGAFPASNEKDAPPFDFNILLVSFLIAFITMRYGAQIIQSFGGIIGIGKLLIGLPTS